MDVRWQSKRLKFDKNIRNVTSLLSSCKICPVSPAQHMGSEINAVNMTAASKSLLFYFQACTILLERLPSRGSISLSHCLQANRRRLPCQHQLINKTHTHQLFIYCSINIAIDKTHNHVAEDFKEIADFTSLKRNGIIPHILPSFRIHIFSALIIK